ncbi:hypothetical protein [Methanolapillus millepedarum]|uniref:Uncharacterized protein n=1 Tax=Methanolapillus millepedarum TaxID=3028296 RepID=A0AA96V1M2_9EURY|nr:hypothetical protein MsAc7_02430 [Methanosarcinaceae archaeon Ac7]
MTTSIYDRLKSAQSELESYQKSHPDDQKQSFLYFVRFSENVKGIMDDLFKEVIDMESGMETSLIGKPNANVVAAVRNSARKKIAENKLKSQAADFPASKKWTAKGIDAHMERVKELEQTAKNSLQELDKLESFITKNMTISNYKPVRDNVVVGLQKRKADPGYSVENLIDAKYRIFVSGSDIKAVNVIFDFLIHEIDTPELNEISAMNYVPFKYLLISAIDAARISAEFLPSYEVYRFASSLPKTPDENSELVQKIPELISFSVDKMRNMMKLAKSYESFEKDEEKVLS